MIPDELIQDVLERTDIVALIGRTIDLRKAGALFKGLCPFHQERTPSFVVTPVRNTYKCFGCDAHGDALRFLMDHDGMTFLEAIGSLAAEAGVALPEPRPISEAERIERTRRKTQAERLLAIQDQLAAYYTKTLFGPAGREGRVYLNQRGLRRGAVEAFRLGWASGDKADFHDWMTDRGTAREDLELLGILLPPEEGWHPQGLLFGGYLRFRQRVMFPVVDIRGEVTGFGGRIIDPKQKAAKYINSPETPVYTKGDNLYGAFTAKVAARRAGRVVLVEGNIDVIALWQAGLTETVAAMGTALTSRQVRLLKRLSERVFTVMDGDDAGRKAALGGLVPFLEEGLLPRAVMLPPGEDPDSLVRSQGVAVLEKALASAPPLLDLHIDNVVARCPNDPLGHVAALRELVPALQHLDGLELSLYRDRIAKALCLEPSLIDSALGEARTDKKTRATKDAVREPPEGLAGPMDPPAGPHSEGGNLREQCPKSEVQIVEMLMQFPREAISFVEEGLVESLTHGGLADFVRCLCSEVKAGRTAEEALLRLEDSGLRAVLLGRLERPQAVPQTQKTIRAALDESVAILKGRAAAANRWPDWKTKAKAELEKLKGAR